MRNLQQNVMMTIILAALCMSAACAEKALLTAYRANVPPVIDGVLDDPVWQNATVGQPFMSNSGSDLEAQNTVRVAWDDKNVYVAFECFDRFLDPMVQQMDRVKAQQETDGGNVFSDDVVEIWFDIPATGVFQFAANSIGTRWESLESGFAWQAAAARSSDRYVVEFAIPLTILGITSLEDTQWGANFCRSRTAVPELSTWSGLQGMFRQTDQFGLLRFAAGGPALLQGQIRAVDEVNRAFSARVSAPAGTADLKAQVTLFADRQVVEEKAAAVAVGETGQAQVSIPFRLPQAGIERGMGEYQFALLAGEEAVYRSAVLQERLGLALASLDVDAPEGTAVKVFLNGEPADNRLSLQQGLNIIAVEVPATAGWIRPVIRSGNQVLAADERWQCAVNEPAEGWMTDFQQGEFGRAVRFEQGIWSADAAAQSVWFRRGLWVSPPGARLFPRTDKAWVTAGGRHIIKPYLPEAPTLSTQNYSLMVRVPSYMTWVAADGSDGNLPDGVEKVGTETINGREYSIYRAAYDLYPGIGLELSLRWTREDKSTIGYVPSIQAGGTFDWRRFSMKVRAPENAGWLHPLVIKWQDRDITGTFWVDNITVRKVGSDEDLLGGVGDFEGEAWSGLIQDGFGRDGTRGMRIVSTPEIANQQQALWIPQSPVVQIEGGAEYIVELDAKAENLVSPRNRPMASLLFAVDPEAPQGEDAISVYFEAEDGAVTEIGRETQLAVLPSLLGVRPEHIRITPCYYSDTYSDDKVLEAVADNFWRSGMIANYGGAENEVIKRLRQRGEHEAILSIPYTPWAAPPTMRTVADDRPEARATEYPDKPSPNRLCPTWALKDGQDVLQAVEDWVASLVADGLYQGADWDLEDPVISRPTYCFCSRCIESYREREGIADDVELTPEIIVAEHRDGWTDFRVHQNAILAGIIGQGARKGWPEIEYSMYSGYQSTRTREHYGVEWTILKPHLDLGIAGYNGGRADIQATVQALAPVPFMGGEMYYLSPRTDEMTPPNPLTWRNRLLRQCIESGGMGVLIWYLPTMEGAAFYYTSEAAAVLARHEDIIHRNERCDDEVAVQGLQVENWFALKRDNRRLVVLLNFSADEAAVSVTLPDEWRDAQVSDPVTGEPAGAFAAPTGVVTIPPYGVRVIFATL